MKTFTDNQGRAWAVAINTAQLKRARDLTGSDVFALLDSGWDALMAHLSNPIHLVDLLYALVKAEADARKVTDEDFGAAMGGDCLSAATDALLEELISFFPNPKRRAALTSLRAKAAEVERLGLAEAGARVEALDPAAVVAALSRRSTASPASSASTPAR